MWRIGAGLLGGVVGAVTGLAAVALGALLTRSTISSTDESGADALAVVLAAPALGLLAGALCGAAPSSGWTRWVLGSLGLAMALFLVVNGTRLPRPPGLLGHLRAVGFVACGLGPAAWVGELIGRWLGPKV
jgi:hypothetical protein